MIRVHSWRSGAPGADTPPPPSPPVPPCLLYPFAYCRSELEAEVQASEQRLQQLASELASVGEVCLGRGGDARRMEGRGKCKHLPVLLLLCRPTCFLPSHAIPRPLSKVVMSSSSVTGSLLDSCPQQPTGGGNSPRHARFAGRPEHALGPRAVHAHARTRTTHARTHPPRRPLKRQGRSWACWGSGCRG